MDDRVRLTVNGEEVQAYGSYQVTSSVFQQPAAFSMSLGHSGVLRDLIRRYPPASEFSLFVGERKIQGGYTDGFRARNSALNIEGRDITSRLYDSFVDSEQSFANKSYLDLLRDVLAKVSLGDRKVTGGNETNRKAISGSRTVAAKVDSLDLFNVVTQEQYTLTSGSNRRTVQNTIKATLGQRWFDFLQREFKKAGIFMWADVEGGFRLARPSAEGLAPSYRIARYEGVSSILRYNVPNNIAQRYTRAVVYGRAGGRKFGRRRIRGEFVDPEMAAIFGGTDLRSITYHDPDVDSIGAAEFVARRHIADANRQARPVHYTLAGHTTPGLNGEARVVWTPDTVVEVDDDLAGVRGRYYVSEVTFNRGPQTTTDLVLLRPEDLVFGEDFKRVAA